MVTPLRPKSLIFPREHGAWGILLIPLVTGGSAGMLDGGKPWPLTPLTIAVLALFWLRTPLESWIGAAPVKARTPSEFSLVRKAALILAAIAALALVFLFRAGRNLGLLWIGIAAAAAFLGQAWIKQAGKHNRAAAQIVGAAGLTATAPAAYYVATGHFGGIAWMLWIANFLFAANQIQFVQLRIRAARAVTVADKLSAGRAFLIAQIILLVLLAMACSRGAFPWYAAMAFAPVLYRGFAWFVGIWQVLAVHSLGKRELAYACVFGVLLIAGLALP